jgi:hypothetical protein
MARALAIGLLVLVAAASASAQDIVDNPFPKNGDVCRDAGDQWRNIKLGKCEAGTHCQAYKRGAWPVRPRAGGRGPRSAARTNSRARASPGGRGARGARRRAARPGLPPPQPGAPPRRPPRGGAPVLRPPAPRRARARPGAARAARAAPRLTPRLPPPMPPPSRHPVPAGVYKCVADDNALGSLPLGTVCYNETQVDQKDKAEGERWRKYYRERNCVFEGIDRQGTPLVQCIQTKEDPKIYKCGRIMPLDAPGCYTVAGSMIWGKWNDNQMYDACNGCPCTPPEKTRCKSGPCKYPACKCNEPCDATRRAQKCATS